MAFLHQYPYPVIPLSGSVVTSGLFGDLKDLAGSHSVGIFDARTYGVATASGNGDKFFIGYSSDHTRDALTKFWTGMTNPLKSEDFKGSDVELFHVSYPQRLQNEKWSVGYDGTADSIGLTFSKGKRVGVRITVKGEPAYRVFQRTIEHEVFVTVPDCGDLCVEGCDTLVDGSKYVNLLAEYITHHPELSILGVRARVRKSTYSVPTPNMTIWDLTVCDNGDNAATAAVQAVIGSDGEVYRKSRSGSISTYRVCLPDAVEPADFVPTEQISIAECGTCPAGYAFVPAAASFYVTRAITPSTDLSTTGAQTTYAGTIADAYEAAEVATIPTTDVNITDNIITETAHGFVTGQPIVYANGGGSSITGLTSATTYYAIVLTANTFKVATTQALALAGTAIDISGTGNNAQTFTPVYTATYVGKNDAVATVLVRIPDGVAIPSALLSDVVFAGSTEPAYCNPTDPTPIEWTESGEAYRGQRVLRMTLPRVGCEGDLNGTNRLAELVAYYADREDIAAAPTIYQAGTACSDIYSITQWSVGCSEDGCLSSAVLDFNDLGGFAGGQWEPVPVADAEDTGIKYGLEIEGGYFDTVFNDCSFNPRDYFNVDPIRFEVSLVTYYPELCDYASLPKARRTQAAIGARQSGEHVMRDYLYFRNSYTPYGEWSKIPRIREAMDMNTLSQVDRTAYYRLYYIRFKGTKINTQHGQEPQMFEAVIPVKETELGKAQALEAAVLGALGKFGVKLEVR